MWVAGTVHKMVIIMRGRECSRRMCMKQKAVEVSQSKDGCQVCQELEGRGDGQL